MKYKADDYAKWIVDNKSQKGTDRFNTVAKAYEEAKQTELEDKNRTFPSAIVKGAETLVPNVISGVSDFYKAAKENPVEVAKSVGSGLVNALKNVALLPINSIANTPNPITESIYDKYGSMHIEITGGEPFIYDNFIYLVKEISQRHTIRITTNLSLNIEEFISENNLACSSSLSIVFLKPFTLKPIQTS